jgi:CRISPR-associated endoribonuclease Cas6
MHLSVVLESESGQFEVPIQYNYPIQAAIYRALTKDVGGFFHNVGFEHKGRRFKMFTFSRLMGKSTLNKERGTICFEGPVTLVVSSPISQFCSSLATGLLNIGTVRIGSALLRVITVQVSEPLIAGESVDLRVISPVVAYSTMTRHDGRKYTCYFAPGEREFCSLTEENLRKKYAILAQSEAPVIPPYDVTAKGNLRLSVITYKGTVIKGYTCFLRLTGPAPLLQVAIDAGLGAKNSQGFGCVVQDKPNRPGDP